MDKHPEADSFRAAWDAALDLGVRRIEDAAMDRALYGTEETIHYHGEHVATRRRYNERLVMFILRNRAPERFAEGKPKGLSAMDRMELTRLRNQWRKEWERERAAEQMRQEVATIESINAKIDLIRAKEEALESPRVRALREAYEEAIAQAEREDRENHYNPYKDPEHELYRGDPPERADTPAGAHEIVLYDTDEEADGAGLLFNGPVAFHPPQAPAEPPEQAPQERCGPRVWTLKDERWRGR